MFILGKNQRNVHRLIKPIESRLFHSVNEWRLDKSYTSAELDLNYKFCLNSCFETKCKCNVNGRFMKEVIELMTCPLPYQLTAVPVPLPRGHLIGTR